MNTTSNRILQIVSGMLALSIAVAVMTATKRVSAATITVMNTNDSGAGSLRQAIIDASAGDAIDFSVTGTITLTTGELPINKDLSIAGPGASNLTVSGNHASRVFEVAIGKTVSISGLTISDGVNLGGAGGGGGGIKNNSNATLALMNVVLSGNKAMGASGDGGGIENFGDLTITSSTLSGNSAFLFGGGISSVGSLTISNSTVSSNSTNGTGGGITNSSGTLTILNSTLSENSASTIGGGILNNGGPSTITNSTLSGNSATGGGGGIYNLGGTLNVSFTTLSGNSASSGGGIQNSDLATVNIKNSIVANSPSGGDCFNAGTWNATGKNFNTNGSCPGFTQVTSAQLNLGPLANNGGPTQTHALLAGSVAIDAVTDCTDVSGNPVTTDQRGFARPIDGDGNGSALCDVGAFEGQCITCPANITQPNDPDQCGAVVTYPNPTATESCSPFGCSPESGSFYPKGTTTVTCSPKQDSPFSCSFTVTVNDTQAPSIICPDNIVTNTDPGQCSAVVTYTTPAANDNCDANLTVTCTPASGSSFQKGTTTVTCSAMDSSGNKGSCMFTVTVNDAQPPTITCPNNIVKPNDPDQCGAVVTFAPTVTDNCPGAGATCSPASGAFFPKGTTTVTCKATDASNNMSTCSFTVTVNDTQKPSITCPADQNAAAQASCPIQTATVVNYPNPTVSDNCPGATFICSPPSGSSFPVGTTTVTCTATDSSGNTAQCTFTVSAFSFCLQDDSSAGNVVLVNAQTGDFIFCCGGTSIASGRGTLNVRGCIGSIDSSKGDRQVHIQWDTSANNTAGAGTAFVQKRSNKIVCQITDKNMSNNTCQCSSPPVTSPKTSD